MIRRALALAALSLLLGMGGDDQRFHRPLEAPQGFASLEIPDDVLDAARPGLADLRIRTAEGKEIPYALDGRFTSEATPLPLLDVESVPGRETTAVVDRGAAAGAADAVRVEAAEAEFIKPAVVEASSDRKAWSEIARGSIFSTASASMTWLRFAPNDRRYWRLRLDDKNGPPIHVRSVAAAAPARRHERRAVSVEFVPQPDAELDASTYAVALPAANLAVVEVTVRASDAAFARRVRVYERIWLRDEVSRRLLGEGEIARGADGRESTAVAVTEPTGKSLEIDVERSAGLPLAVTSIAVAVIPRALLFHAPGGPLELWYGSSAAAAPAYDFAAALGKGLPPSFGRATLGAPLDTGRPTAAAAEVTRGGALDSSAWKGKRPIVLPTRGHVAYLDVDGRSRLADLRIADPSGRQVPYLIESQPRHERIPLTFRAESGGRATLLRVAGLDAKRAVEALLLDVSAPDYFARDVSVVETTSDARGVTGERLLGTVHAAKSTGTPRSPIRIPIAPSSGGTITLRIEDGDNAPLTVASLAADGTRRRLDFLFEPGERLTYLSGNDAASAPRYDLGLIAAQVLASPAEAATLGEPEPTPLEPPKTPRWFWIFVLGTAILLFFAVARVLRQEPRPPSARPPSG